MKTQLIAFIELLRPHLIARSLFPFILAVIITQASPSSAGLVVSAGALLALLWSALYALNDYADFKVDSLHESKKRKPLPSKRISKKTALTLTLLLLLFALAFSLSISVELFYLFALMTLTQWAYSFPPLHLKNRAFFDLVQQAVNPALRFLTGWVLFNSISNAFLALDALIGLSFLFAGTYAFEKTKQARVKAEKKLRVKNTISLLGVENTRRLAYSLIAVSIAAWLYAFLAGSLSLTVLALILLSALLFAPFYLKNKDLLEKDSTYSTLALQLNLLLATILLFAAWFYGLL